MSASNNFYGEEPAPFTGDDWKPDASNTWQDISRLIVNLRESGLIKSIGLPQPTTLRMTQAAFDKLPVYGVTTPTGLRIGKMWRHCGRERWYVARMEATGKPGEVRVVWYLPLISRKGLTAEEVPGSDEWHLLPKP